MCWLIVIDYQFFLHIYYIMDGKWEGGVGDVIYNVDACKEILQDQVEK